MYRPAELSSGHQQRWILRIDRRFHAEGAADVFRDHTQLLVRQTHNGGPLAAQRVGTLRACVERVAVVGLIVDTSSAARLHRRDDHTLVGAAHLGHMLGLAEAIGSLSIIEYIRATY